MTGGADLPVGFVMEQSYSRDMETDADHFALELMGDASIETQSTAKLFRTISTESRYAEIASFLPEILSSHPEMTGRIDLFEQSDITGTLDINPQDWKALQTVCD
ncbi:MAG: M48 family metalloprotease [Rhodospirillales bacterium]|nr:M48 family metalloprotease [Rhodospirillales bacterium]|eukprot:TRINITY_DN7790_c0_g1_i1.p1 TRINITY_DN7790_c0_g1~~TRINITY_DN7790_c0_g1_i1.p1  ORF type:complete len:105 (+),score=16.60 TRINITY_DN7790_c0_g1_i1:3-317(+)